jgi:hypothetical protein
VVLSSSLAQKEPRELKVFLAVHRQKETRVTSGLLALLGLLELKVLLVVKVLLDLLDQKVLMGKLGQKETRALKGPLVPLVIKDKKD